MRRIIGIFTLFYSLLSLAESTRTDESCTIEQPLGDNSRIIGYLELGQGQEKLTALHADTNIQRERPLGMYLEVLNTQAEGGRDLVIALWENNKKSGYVLAMPLGRYSEKRGGMSTLDGIDVIWPPAGDGWPAFYLRQTSLPGKSDSHFMPSAPQDLRLQYQPESNCYRPVRAGR